MQPFVALRGARKNGINKAPVHLHLHAPNGSWGADAGEVVAVRRVIIRFDGRT
jgi:hypothetical protein